jgi:hypothetical protein
MTAALTLNVVFAAAVLTAVLGLIVWAVLTAERDRGVTLARRRRHPHRPAHAPAFVEPMFIGRRSLSQTSR